MSESDSIGHKCAVVALKTQHAPAVPIVAKILHANWNRGGAGFQITAITRDGIGHVCTGKEKTELEPAIQNPLPDNIRTAMGHDRYVTSGEDLPEQRQPFIFEVNGKKYFFCFNGNIANFDELRVELADRLQHDVDTDAIRVCLEDGIRQYPDDMAAVFRSLQQKLDGAFNIVLANEDGGVWGYRDANGFRPLVTGSSLQRGSTECSGFIASEDGAIYEALLDISRIIDVEDVPPGSMVTLGTNEPLVTHIAETTHRQSRCFFEWVYFSKLLSTLDDVQVKNIRQRFGTRLALEERYFDAANRSPDDVCIGVPQSGIAGGERWASTIGMPYHQGIIRNPATTGRGFLQGTPDARREYAKQKYGFIPSEITGKRLFLTEDSVVRGTTMETMIHELRKLNPAEIHLRIACPPIIGPCFYGIDFPTLKELIAGEFRAGILANGGELTPEMEAAIARKLGVDSVQFLSKAGMLAVFAACGMTPDKLCTACVDGTADAYPTPAGQRLAAREFGETSHQ